MSNKKNNRRGFLKKIFAASATVGFTGATGINTKAGTEKIKMLTADGKLVEVDKSILDKATDKKRASNEEVFKWMSSKQKNI